MGRPNYAQFGIGFMLAELMYGQKPIMPIEQTISLWAAVDWRDKMSREELLAACGRKPEDMERAKAKLHAAKARNKSKFDRTHRIRPKKIKEGDWVIM